MARKVYDPEQKTAVMAALLTGQGVNEVAEKYDLPTSTVSRWKKEARETAGRSEEIGDLLLTYLKISLQALAKQAQHFADVEWLKKQDASQLAVLHGVMTDKAVRLLEAMEAPSHG